MQRYFFHQVHAGQRIEDPEGSLHATVDGARHEALTSALEIMVGRLWKGQNPDHSRFEVTDISGKLVLVVPFRDAINRGEPAGSQPEDDINREIASRD